MEFSWVKVMQHVFIASSIKQRKNERVKTTDQKRAKHDHWSLNSLLRSRSLWAPFSFESSMVDCLTSTQSQFTFCVGIYRTCFRVFSSRLRTHRVYLLCLCTLKFFFLSLESLKLKNKIKKFIFIVALNEIVNFMKNKKNSNWWLKNCWSDVWRRRRKKRVYTEN